LTSICLVGKDVSDLTKDEVQQEDAVNELEQKLQQSSITTESLPLASNENSPSEEGVIPPAVDTIIEPMKDISDPTPAEVPLADEVEADEYLLKEIDWIDPNTGAEKRVKIVTQNSMFWKEWFKEPALQNYLTRLLCTSRKWSMPAGSHR
jgi:cell division septum initiation protein DivIVA